MKKIYWVAAMIFLFSCKKNVEAVPAIESNDAGMAGQWTSDYLSQKVKMAIDAENRFTMELPLIVKKKADAKPETLIVQANGICVEQEGGYELQSEGWKILYATATGDNEQHEKLLMQSIQGVELKFLRAGNKEGDSAFVSCRLGASGALWKN